MNIREAFDIILNNKYTYMAEQIDNLDRKVTADDISNIEDQYDTIYQEFCELGFALCNLKAFIDKKDKNNEAKERENILQYSQKYGINSIDDAIAAYENIPAELEFFGTVYWYGEEESLHYGSVVTSDECIKYNMYGVLDD